MLHDINMTTFLEFMFVSTDCVQWCFQHCCGNSAKCNCYSSTFIIDSTILGPQQSM